MKRCTICGEVKALSDFNLRKGTRDGLRADCRDCKKKRDSEYRAEHKERINAQIKDWYVVNRDKTLERRRSKYEDRKDEILEANRKWRQDNPEKKRACHWRGKARRRNAEGRFTGSDISHLITMQKGKCASCARSIADGYHVDHIKPIILGGTNWPNNLQLLCPTCNLKKGGKDPFVFAKSLGKLF